VSQQVLDPFVVGPARPEQPVRLAPRRPVPSVFDRVPITVAPAFVPPRLRLVVPDHLEGALRPARRLHEPAGSPSLRLTARGRAAVVVAVALAAIGVVLALVLLPSAPTGPAAGRDAGPASSSVVVQPGDSLWSIATRVAPKADPRATVQRLIDRNHLAGLAITPGEVLATS
jgi:hypothetical protein